MGGRTGSPARIGPDVHVTGATLDRDFRVDRWEDLVQIRDGDRCPIDGGRLEIGRSIVVGHIYQLGTYYSEPLGATYQAEDGSPRPYVMGSYGIGISRIMAATVEQHHDDAGMIWPKLLAPYEVAVIMANADAPAVTEEAERIYRELGERGIEAVLDDREERAGVKFADADLVGYPVQVVVGSRGLEAGTVDLKARATGSARRLRWPRPRRRSRTCSPAFPSARAPRFREPCLYWLVDDELHGRKWARRPLSFSRGDIWAERPDRDREEGNVDAEALVRPVIEGEGLELVDVTFGREDGRRILRVTVDREGGVDLDTISQLSQKVSRRLDLEGFEPGPYALEVTTPGIERPLRRPQDFRRAVGQRVLVKTEARACSRASCAPPRTMRSAIAAHEGEHRVALDEVAAAKTVVDWDAELKGSDR